MDSFKAFLAWYIDEESEWDVVNGVEVRIVVLIPLISGWSIYMCPKFLADAEIIVFRPENR